MYSMVMMMAVAGSGDVASYGHRGGCGCSSYNCGGCYSCGGGCYSSCHGRRGCNGGGFRCHGCGGCYGGSCQGGCYGYTQQSCGCYAQPTCYTQQNCNTGCHTQAASCPTCYAQGGVVYSTPVAQSAPVMNANPVYYPASTPVYTQPQGVVTPVATPVKNNPVPVETPKKSS